MLQGRFILSNINCEGWEGFERLEQTHVKIPIQTFFSTKYFFNMHNFQVKEKLHAFKFEIHIRQKK